MARRERGTWTTVTVVPADAQMVNLLTGEPTGRTFAEANPTWPEKPTWFGTERVWRWRTEDGGFAWSSRPPKAA